MAGGRRRQTDSRAIIISGELPKADRLPAGGESLDRAGGLAPPSPDWLTDARIRVGAVFQAVANEIFAIQVDQLSPPMDFVPGGWPQPENTWMQPRDQSFGRIMVTAGAPNDDFVNATEIVPFVSSSAFALALSLEAGEPAITGAPSAGSLWWKWTAGTDGWVGVFNVQDVFTGDSLGTLQPVALVIPRAAPNAIPRFRAQAGVTYHFRTTANPEFQSWIKISPEAPNNSFAGALELPFDTGELPQPPGISSVDPGEPEPGFNASTGIVWFHWTPSRSGRYSCWRSSYLTYYTGDRLENLRVLARPSPDLIDVTAGTRISIAAQADDHGVLPDRIILFPPVWNDDFALATPVTGPAVFSNFPTVPATAEPGEPSHGGEPALASQWFAWQARTTDPVAIFLRGQGGPRLAVYRGDSLTALEPVAGFRIRQELSEYTGTALIQPRPGETLRVALEGGGPVHLEFSSPPKNDKFTNSSRVNHAPLSGTTLGAWSDDTDQLGSGQTNLATVWYHANARVDSRLAIRLTQTADSDRRAPARIRVFRGSNDGPLVLATQSAPLAGRVPAVAYLTAAAGERLWFQVMTPADHPDFFNIQLDLLPVAPPPGNTPLTLQPTGVVGQLRLLGPDGQIARLEQSFDLQHWELLGDAEIAGAKTLIDLHGIEGGSTRFIRAREP